MRITTLGPLAVDGTPVGGKRLAVVVRELVAARGRAVSAAALADAVWQGDPPEDTTGAVQALVSRVRRLGVPVVAVPGGYRTPADAVETDIGAARELAARARAALRAGDPAAARTAADAARALFPEVPDLTGTEVARLFADVAAVRAECALAGAGAHEQDDLRRLAGRTPPDEPAAALLVRVLAAQGRDAEALDVVARLRADLADRYGTDPSPVVADVHLALLRGELTGTGPRRAVRSVMPASWRRPGTVLVGRERDVTAVGSALATAPLVTVVATGGAGKTRLAAEVARRATGAVRVVELAGLRLPEQVAPAVLTALGGSETTTALAPERRVLSPRDRLRVAAAELDGLVVLDNCEHLLDAAAAVVADLLDAAPDVAVLATSRAPLGLAGEVVHRLATLPDDQALALLEARARAGGAMSAWDTGRALRVCHHLDNLPLALELAAARLRHMPIDDVLAGLSDRFTLLDAALRGLPDRHAGLWAMVDWSRELLAGDERELLQRLAVIPAPFTAATAAAVAGRPDVRRGLAVLVEQSLLVIEDGAGPPRYRMLETVREYGEARLGDRAPAMTGLVSWARALAVGLSADIVGPRQLETIGVVAREQENLLAALRWALDTGDEPAAVDLAAALFYPAMIRGLHLEVSAWGGALLHAGDPVARSRSALLRGEGADADRIALVSLLIGVNAGITGPMRLTVLANRTLRAVLSNRAAGISPRNTALAGVLPLMRDLHSGQARAGVDGLLAHDDPYVRAFGLFARSAIRESMDGARVFEDAEEAYDCFEAAGDHWGMGMAAQGAGNSVDARTAGTAVAWLARSVRHMELIGADPEARSVRVLLDTQLALDGDAGAERRLHDTAVSGQAQEWDHAQAHLGLANLAWQRGDPATMLRRAAEIARAAHHLTDPQPHQRVLLRVAAAVLHLAATTGRPPAAAAALLIRARDDISGGHDLSLLGAWAIGGALLAERRGGHDTARELWALGIRTGAALTTMFAPAEFAHLTAPLTGGGHDGYGPGTTARIDALMATVTGSSRPA
ncbi:ATP-binding protein [Actinoplanes sp. NPDC051494]|uniref:ATP-binding protein n=1 Tax=Actinoplanes sp. NPDC051494 TaxID=3363907 RepID=UPI003796BDBB